MHFSYLFLFKNHFWPKNFSLCWDKLDYPGSNVYLSRWGYYWFCLSLGVFRGYFVLVYVCQDFSIYQHIHKIPIFYAERSFFKAIGGFGVIFASEAYSKVLNPVEWTLFTKLRYKILSRKYLLSKLQPSRFCIGKWGVKKCWNPNLK